MGVRLLLGDEAVAQAAIHAGIGGAFSYAGTPATEIFEHVEAEASRTGRIAARWSRLGDRSHRASGEPLTWPRDCGRFILLPGAAIIAMSSDRRANSDRGPQCEGPKEDAMSRVITIQGVFILALLLAGCSQESREEAGAALEDAAESMSEAAGAAADAAAETAAEAADHFDAATEAAGEAAGEAMEMAEEAAENAMQKAGELMEEGQSAAEELADEAQQKADQTMEN